MQLHAIGVAVSHFGNLLSFLHSLVFLHQDRLVVRVGGEIRIVVLENDQVAVTAQTGACIDHSAIASSQHGIPGFPTNVQSLVFGLVESCQQRSVRWPDPTYILITTRRTRRRRSGYRCRLCCNRTISSPAVIVDCVTGRVTTLVPSTDAEEAVDVAGAAAAEDATGGMTRKT